MKSLKRVALALFPPVWPKMPPIGLYFLQSFLKKKNLKADIFDANVLFYGLSRPSLRREWLVSCNTALESSISNILKENYKADFNAIIGQLLDYEAVGFSCFKSNFSGTLEVIRLLKERKKNVKIILGGPEVARRFFKGRGSFDSELLAMVDFLVVGEGEVPLAKFLSGESLDGKVAAFYQLEALEELSFPRYGQIAGGQYPPGKALPLQFSRGCVRACGFCSERLLYKGFRARPVAHMLEEIRCHQRRHTVNNFVFFDSMLNADLKAFEALCDGMATLEPRISWEAQIAVRPDMPQVLFEKMKKSGCYNLFVGLESGSDKTLRRMRKGFTRQEAAEFFKRLSAAGLSFGISMIIGFPGETGDDFKESLDFVIANRHIIPKIEQVNPFTYYDGTDADPSADYSVQKSSLARMRLFMDEVKKHKIKYTNAFIGNLIEKNAYC